ncbi:methylated-DNA--[protein]-cysteine S-methyltransferase [Catalinimonas sp. 4WD22]|uniref:bifunctional transcriptional activator/DNA repair enzyme AdaA n=1 Tax=Catalinimonas locisalis TaxID=3133978 RepID=UPI003101695E
MKITDPQKIQLYYQALLDRDTSFVGIFFVGVKTTSVFCIASCRARKPKKENVEFFSHFKDALANGFRPCKICRPTAHAHAMPEQVALAIRLLEASPEEKISDTRLREEQISPSLVRRWFKQHYGLTFQAYQRMQRVNQAFRQLKAGSSGTAAAYDAGYESLSGFNYTYKKLLGSSPDANGHQNILLISRFTTPLGPMFVCASDTGICLLEFTDRRMLETELDDLQSKLKARMLAGENQHSRQAIKEVQEYFEGKRKQFEVALDTPGTAFQQKVWQALSAIPYGCTSSYQQQAQLMGDPHAVRAAARANGMNRVAIIIPCHRVIGKDGSLTGYGGRLQRKQWLLDWERKHISSDVTASAKVPVKSMKP